MEHSDLYTVDLISGRLDAAAIKSLVDAAYQADNQSRAYFADDSEEQKLTRNALRVGNIELINALWERRYGGAGFPWADHDLYFALRNSDFKTFIHVFKEWSFGCEELQDQLTSSQMIEIAKSNTKCGDKVIEFIRGVEMEIGDIYVYNVNVREDEDDDDVYEDKCTQLKKYIDRVFNSNPEF